jgi:hypothetical protein
MVRERLEMLSDAEDAMTTSRSVGNSPTDRTYDLNDESTRETPPLAADHEKKFLTPRKKVEQTSNDDGTVVTAQPPTDNDIRPADGDSQTANADLLLQQVDDVDPSSGSGLVADDAGATNEWTASARSEIGAVFSEKAEDEGKTFETFHLQLER